jgi:hypothetical protein
MHKLNHLKNIFIATFLLVVCVNVANAQINSFFVQAYQTDPAYSTTNDSNYVVINTAVNPVNKLLFYIGGTNSSPKRTTLFLKLAANLGYHVISVAYPNSVAAQTACAASADINCYSDFRQEVCFGTPLSASITVDTLNSLNTRAVKLIKYLHNTYPSQNWGQFVNGANLVWGKLVTSGHSQGSGNALYFAKVNEIDRCIMFSGANDYSNFYNAVPSWISTALVTPKAKLFSFLHQQDETVPYADQIKVTQALGLWQNGDDSTSIDNASSPYNNSHLLYTNQTPQSTVLSAFHNSTVIDMWTPLDNNNSPQFLPVWTYLLTANTTTSLNAINSTSANFDFFPNPCGDILTLNKKNDVAIIQIITLQGKVLKTYLITAGERSIYVGDIEAGVYFLKHENQTARFIKK